MSDKNKKLRNPHIKTGKIIEGDHICVNCEQTVSLGIDMIYIGGGSRVCSKECEEEYKKKTQWRYDY